MTRYPHHLPERADAACSRRSLLGWAAGLALLPGVAAAAPQDDRRVLRAEFQQALDAYLASRRGPEGISGISAFASLAEGETGISAVTGKTMRAGQGVPVTRRTLYEIGSNTKAFTAVMLLQLEAEGRLGLDQTVGDWLPQYQAWADVSIRRLLHMTSGIPTYSEAPAFMRAQAADMNRHFTPERLVAYAYPSRGNTLPVDDGWFYSNTNYILAGMIAEKAGRASYGTQLRRRFFQPLFMRQSFYDPWALPEGVLRRMSSGYFQNPECSLYEPDCAVPPLMPLRGKDMRRADISWTGAAGGIVATPRDLQRWGRALFGGRLLPPGQMHQLLQLVSRRTGRPIAGTTPDDPAGFGLGVAQFYAPGIGPIWVYEGMTLGYRTLLAWFPQEDLVLTMALNSQPPAGENHSSQLMTQLYQIARRRR